MALIGAKWGSKLGKDSEHQQWVRDERMKVYVEFLSALNAEIAKINIMEKPEPIHELPTAPLRNELARIEVLGSQKVRVLARKLPDHVGVCQTSARFVAGDIYFPGNPDEGQEQRLNSYHGVVRALNDLLGDYVEAVRKDLGTAGKDDDRTSGINEGVMIGPLPKTGS